MIIILFYTAESTLLKIKKHSTRMFFVLISVIKEWLLYYSIYENIFVLILVIRQS